MDRLVPAAGEKRSLCFGGCGWGNGNARQRGICSHICGRFVAGLNGGFKSTAALLLFCFVLCFFVSFFLSFFLHCMIALGTHFQGYTSGCTSSLGDIDYACITGIDLESEDLGGK